MAHTTASSKAKKENKKAPAANLNNRTTRQVAAGKKNTKATDAPLTNSLATNAAPAPKGRRAGRSAAGLVALRSIDTNIDPTSEAQPGATGTDISNDGASHSPATNASKDYDTLAAENAALEAQLEQTNAQLEATSATLMRIKARDDTKPLPKELIPEPKKKPYSLLKAMGLKEDKLLYNACRATARETVKAKFQVYMYDWRKQDAEFIASAHALIEKRQPVLKNYERGWATLEMMRSYMKGKRAYKALLAKLEADHYAAAKKLFGGINLSAAKQPVPFVPDSDVEEDGGEAPIKKKGCPLQKKIQKTVVDVEDDSDDEGEGEGEAEEEEEEEEERRGKGKPKGKGEGKPKGKAKPKEKAKLKEKGKPKPKGKKRARVVESSSEEDNVSGSDAESFGDSDGEEAPVKAKTNSVKAPKAKKARVSE